MADSSKVLEEKYCPCGNRAQILCIRCQDFLCDRCYDVGEGYCEDCEPEDEEDVSE